MNENSQAMQAAASPGPTRHVRRVLRALRRGVWVLLSCLALTALTLIAWLGLMGLPGRCVKSVLAPYESRELSVNIGRLRWSPQGGPRVEDVRMVVGAESPWTIAAAELSLEPGAAWLPRAAPGARLVRLAEASLLPAPESPATALVGPGGFYDISGTIRMESDGDTRIALAGRLGTHGSLTLNGVVHPPERDAHTPDTLTPAQRLDALRRAVEEHLLAMTNITHGLSPGAATHLALTFDITPGGTDDDRIDLRISGVNAVVYGIAVEHWDADMTARPGAELTLRSATLRSALGSSTVAGRYDFATTAYSADILAHLTVRPLSPWLPIRFESPMLVRAQLSGVAREHGSLRAAACLRDATDPAGPPPDAHLDATATYAGGTATVERTRIVLQHPDRDLPPAWREALAASEVSFDGPLAVTIDHAELGVQEGGAKARGTVACESLSWRGSRFRDAVGTFETDGDRIAVHELRTRLGEQRTDKADTFLLGTIEYQPDTHQLNGHVETRAYPAELAAVLPKAADEVLATTEFRDPVGARVDFTLCTTNADDTVVTAALHAEELVRNGVALQAADATLRYNSNGLTCDDIRLVRPEGILAGNVRQHFASQRLDLAVHSSLEPHATARLVGGKLPELLAGYRFGNRADLRVDGSVGYGTNDTRNLTVALACDGLAFSTFALDHTMADLTITADSIACTNLTADWLGGRIFGSGALVIADGGRTTNFVTSLRTLHIDFGELVRSFQPDVDVDAYTGRLYANLNLSGTLGTNLYESLNGNGRIEIRNGYLLTIPLLGGLSRYLSFIIPGLGFASQREFRAAFVIRESAIGSNDAQLQGSLITVKGRGRYTFGKDLDVKVQVLFLKGGFVARVARIVTSPLTKALVFRLSGTLDDPQWSPLNTPMRLFNFFHRAYNRAVD